MSLVRPAVLFISWYVGLGGGETDLLALAQGLADRLEPHLCLPRSGPLSESWTAQGWPVHVLPFRGASTWFVPRVWARFPVVGQLKGLLRRENIALIYSDYHSLPYALPAAQAIGLPVAWVLWGWWFKPRPWQKTFFCLPQVAIAKSQAIARGFLGQPPFMPPQRVPVIYPGVDAARFHPSVDGAPIRALAGVPQGAPLVALIARFQRVKGHHTFQDMARLVLAQRPDCHFVIAGEETFGVSADQAYRDSILRAAQDDPLLRERLHYIGFRTDAEAVMTAADVVVCPSQFESFGKVNVEAMACARPVVSTSQGGPAEVVVDGETGFLVPPEDPPALAAHVLALLDDAALRARMGQAGRARVLAHFSTEEAVRRTWALLEPLLAKSSGPSG
ncbi:MAG: glycosyltransferase family 4 protein [Anaerolineae bacterium]|nr:glycosyltransferase family 4 protein [Anaerolineae bacterium]MDW8173450.1 glycosyltransferase family 4 protein [Anaerolineae bacterium]